MATEATTKQAQRQFPRWQPQGSKPVRVALGPAGSGQLVDISAGGIRVQSLAPLRRDAEVPVRIDIPDRTEPLQVTGIVVWSKPNGAAGIRFANLNDAQKEVLQGWLSDLEHATLNPTKRESPSRPEDDEFTRIVSKVRAAKLNNADALNLIASHVTQATAASGAAIALGTADTMVCMAAAGVAPEIGTSIPSGVGLTGECVRRRKMVHCQNAQNDPRVGRELNLGSAVVLPLLVNGELRGILEAVSLSVYAFDSNAIDTLERLADAVVFLTFGVVPQRRIATVTPLSSATMTRLSVTGSFSNLSAQAEPKRPTPTVSIRPTTLPSTTRPVVPSSPKTAPVASFPLPAAAPKPSSSPKVAPVATRPVAIEKPAASTPQVTVAADPVNIEELDSVARRIPVRYIENFERREQSSPVKWIVAAVVLVVLIGVPTFMWLRKPASNTSTQTAMAATPTNNPEQIAAQPGGENATVAALNEQTPVSTAAAATSSKTPVAAKPTESKDIRQAPAAEKESAAQPAPIIIAGGTSLKRAVSDDDVVAPAAPQLTVPGSGNVPELGLPATASVPKLSAPRAQVRSGGAVLKQVTPIYPQMAKAMHLEGRVELRVKVGKDGSVLSADRLSGHTVLANAAIDAVKRWRYEPFKLDGVPVEMETVVRLSFNAPH